MIMRYAVIVISLVVIASQTLAQGCPTPGTTRYVRENASGNGSSWNCAFGTLEQALDAARANSSISEIRIAQGNYVPEDRVVSTDPLSATFTMVSGVRVRGGFRGNNDTNGDDYDPGDFETNLNSYLISVDDYVYRIVTFGRLRP